MLPWRGYHINPSPFIFSLINHSNTSLSLSLGLLSSLLSLAEPNQRKAGHHLGLEPPPAGPLCSTVRHHLTRASLSLSSFGLYWIQAEPKLLGRSDLAKGRPPPRVDPSTRIVDSTRGLDLIQEVKGLDLALKTSTCSIEGLRWTNWRPRLLSRFGEEGSRKTRCQQPNLAPIVGEVKAYIILVGLNAS